MPGSSDKATDKDQALDGEGEKQIYGGFHCPHLDRHPGRSPYLNICFRLSIGDQWYKRKGLAIIPSCSFS